MVLRAEQPNPATPGKMIELPAPVALRARGPVVEVSISMVPAMAQPILQKGGTIPGPITGLALIDTGAGGTCIDDETAKALSLPVVGIGKMASASEAESERNQYPIQVDFVGWGVKLTSNRATGANLKPHGIVALIGRDMLGSCILVYNGPMGSFSLAL